MILRHAGKDNNTILDYELGHDVDSFVMTSPEKVLAINHKAKYLYSINLTTSEKRMTLL